ncbi:MAG: hypothetical protein LBO68_04775, partial [Synergistaceae bacterium]|nr:hypothetical protein [Synergistaceae bacterium]
MMRMNGVLTLKNVERENERIRDKTGSMTRLTGRARLRTAGALCAGFLFAFLFCPRVWGAEN